MEEFLNQNASAIFALLGALGGGLISFFGSWLIRKRDYNLRLWDKLSERRIAAHENVIAMALEMRVMVALGGTEKNGEVARAPRVLRSKDEFERWFTSFTRLTQGSSTWLTTEAKRELNLVQDYLVTLHMNLTGVSSEKYVQVGRVIRNDFIDLSARLEGKAFEFFEREIQTLKLSSLREWHKYQRPETESYLSKTVLLSEWQQIQRIAQE